MAGEGEKSSDFYAVLGLKKECTEAELRNAYKKLAMRWHPDRCSSSGNLKYVEEAKKKFQAIQEAYSVLSDSNKKFLYDVGVYNCDDDDDDDQNGMGDFLNEMAVMMSQNKSNQEDGEASFEELKELFEEMFQSEIDAFDSSSSQNAAYSSCSAASLFANYGESSNKRDSSNMNSEKSNIQDSSSLGFDTNFHGFCFGVSSLALSLIYVISRCSLSHAIIQVIVLCPSQILCNERDSIALFFLTWLSCELVNVYKTSRTTRKYETRSTRRNGRK